MEHATDAGVKESLDHLLEASNRLVPVEEGDLQLSGQVVDEGLGKGSVQYGTTPETAEYAVVQHERMDFHHPNGGQAKYLETAMVREARAMFQILAAVSRRNFQ
jgi:hypothetical protein